MGRVMVHYKVAKLSDKLVEVATAPFRLSDFIIGKLLGGAMGEVASAGASAAAKAGAKGLRKTVDFLTATPPKGKGIKVLPLIGLPFLLTLPAFITSGSRIGMEAGKRGVYPSHYIPGYEGVRYVSFK